MWPEQQSADWEFCKENVQPLRHGRNVQALNSSLQTSADEQTAQKIAQQRREFEVEIRTYTGDDPLEPWYRYVVWMEQHCPRGGHEGKLDELLKSCVARFHSEQRYLQDPRYVSLCLKLASNAPMAQDIYQRMFHSNIGSKLTMFYTAWAAHLELTGNVRRADAVLREGERLGAQPADQLSETRRKLQMRVAAALAAGQQLAPASEGGAESGTQQTRQALNVLAAGSDAEVPRARVGAAVLGRPGALASASSGQQPRHNSRLKVYVDENAPVASVAASAAAPATRPQSLTNAREARKENVRKAAPWGAPQTAPVGPAPGAAPAFKVYEEAGGGRSSSRLTSNPAALVARADPAPARPAVPWDTPVAVFEPPNPSVVAMYCKDVIYAGAGEVSFEELRAARWQRRAKQLLDQQREAEERRRQEETTRAYQEALQRQEEQQAELQRTKEALERQVLRQQRELQALRQQRQQPGSLSCSNVSAGSSSLGANSLGAHSGCGSLLVAASPTVNTRDALNYVREIMNKTVDTSAVQPPVPRKSLAPVPPATPAFKVYEEPQEVAPALKSYEEPPSESEFRVYEDAQPASALFEIYEEPQASTAAAKTHENPAETAPVSGTAKEEPAGTAATVTPDAPGPSCPGSHPSSDEDSDRENRAPPGTTLSAPRKRRALAGVLVDAVEVPLPEEPEPTVAPPRPDAAHRRTLHFDEELTGFVPRAGELSFATQGEAEFRVAAGRVASTPFVHPAPPVEAAAGRQRRGIEEEGDFTAQLKTVGFGGRFGRPSAGATAQPDRFDLGPISEVSRERFKSSSSSSGSDASRQSRYGDFSAPAWRGDVTRSSSARDPHLDSRRSGSSARALYHTSGPSSGYLGDKSGSALVAPPPPADVSTSMGRRLEPDRSCSALEAPDLSCLPDTVPEHSPAAAAAQSLLAPVPEPELSVLPPPAELSILPLPADCSVLPLPADLSVIPPPAELSVLPPPADLSLPPQPPAVSPPPDPAAALSALSLQEPVQLPDPWDEQLQTQLLEQLPLQQRSGYSCCTDKLPSFTQKEVKIGGQQLSLTLIGEGSYAHVYHAVEAESGGVLCLKVQKTSPMGGRWEFYVVDELHRRLQARSDKADYVMKLREAVFFSNGSILSTEYEPAGTLLSAHNRLRAAGGSGSDTLPLLLTAEMLAVVEAVHSTGILHGDVKPDNFLLRSCALQDVAALVQQLSEAGPSAPPQLVQLIDFGRAIDLTLLPPGTHFTRVVTTDGFTCPEMLEGRPWREHIDLFGLAASAYALLFGQYLKLRRDASGQRWTFTGSIRRYWNQPLWTEFFATFLNLPSEGGLPNLGQWRARFHAAALAAAGGKGLHETLSSLSLRLRER